MKRGLIGAMSTLAVHPGSKMVTGTPPQAAREKHMATRWSSYLRWQREPGGGARRISNKPGAQIIGGHGRVDKVLRIEDRERGAPYLGPYITPI